MKLINDIMERWEAKTPEFFQKIKKFSLSLGVSATSVWVANETMSLDLHVVILEICKYIIAFASAMGFTAQLTKDNNIK
jgi:hypothetical protein